jgi:hypothetical protein
MFSILNMYIYIVYMHVPPAGWLVHHHGYSTYVYWLQPSVHVHYTDSGQSCEFWVNTQRDYLCLSVLVSLTQSHTHTCYMIIYLGSIIHQKGRIIKYCDCNKTNKSVQIVRRFGRLIQIIFQIYLQSFIKIRWEMRPQKWPHTYTVTHIHVSLTASSQLSSLYVQLLLLYLSRNVRGFKHLSRIVETSCKKKQVSRAITLQNPPITLQFLHNVPFDI